jgi:hypothetical protein
VRVGCCQPVPGITGALAGRLVDGCNSLAAKAEAFLVAEEQDGCEMVAAPSARSRKRTQVADEVGGAV